MVNPQVTSCMRNPKGIVDPKASSGIVNPKVFLGIVNPNVPLGIVNPQVKLNFKSILKSEISRWIYSTQVIF